jgi:hypothetical protein
MAIDRGPWNALIDDDGSGLVGTVWNKDKIKTVILDPAEAADVALEASLLAADAALEASLVAADAALLPTYGTFAPTDASGAGLVFGFSQGKYARNDRIVFLWLQVVYPSTSDGAFAKIGGVPYVVSSPVGVAQGYGQARVWWLQEGSTVLEAHDLNTFASITNAQLSGANLILSAVYLTD